MPQKSRRPLDFQTYEALASDVSRLQTAGYQRTGEWSLEQILDHLTKAMTTAMDPSAGLPRLLRPLFKPALWRMLKTRQMPKMPSPKAFRPADHIEPTSALEHFQETVAKARALTADPMDHPGFGKIKLADWHQLQLIHAARHLSFLVPNA